MEWNRKVTKIRTEENKDWFGMDIKERTNNWTERIFSRW